MKTIRIALVGFLIAITSVFAVSAKAADSSVTLSCVTFSWPDTIYRPQFNGNVTFNLSYKNNCEYEVLEARVRLVDKFGSSVADYDVVGLKTGVTFNQSLKWYASDISRGTEPFTLQFIVEHFKTYGISNPVPVNIPFKFTERTAVLPTPTPTVTITATPAPIYITNPADQTLTDLVTTLKSKVSLLKSKLKKICSAKPKPKGC